MLLGLIIIANRNIAFFVLENVLNQELAIFACGPNMALCLFSDNLTTKDVLYIYKCWERNKNIYWHLEII